MLAMFYEYIRSSSPSVNLNSNGNQEGSHKSTDKPITPEILIKNPEEFTKFVRSNHDRDDIFYIMLIAHLFKSLSSVDENRDSALNILNKILNEPEYFNFYKKLVSVKMDPRNREMIREMSGLPSSKFYKCILFTPDFAVEITCFETDNVKDSSKEFYKKCINIFAQYAALLIDDSKESKSPDEDRYWMLDDEQRKNKRELLVFRAQRDLERGYTVCRAGSLFSCSDDSLGELALEMASVESSVSQKSKLK